MVQPAAIQVLYLTKPPPSSAASDTHSNNNSASGGMSTGAFSAVATPACRVASGV